MNEGNIYIYYLSWFLEQKGHWAVIFTKVLKKGTLVHCTKTYFEVVCNFMIFLMQSTGKFAAFFRLSLLDYRQMLQFFPDCLQNFMNFPQDQTMNFVMFLNDSLKNFVIISDDWLTNFMTFFSLYDFFSKWTTGKFSDIFLKLIAEFHNI